VHNGIEYGLMQILAETYDFMLRVLKMNYVQMSDTFARWNNAELNSFLVEITADVLKKTDRETNKPLVEMVLDKAAQKGTGKWTSQAAMDFGVPIPTIDSAVSMRQISAQKEARLLIAEKYDGQPRVAGEQLKTDGETVSSEPQHDMKAALAREEVKTTISEQQEANIGARERETAAKTIDNPADDAKNQELRDECVENFDLFIEQLKNTLLASFVTTYAQGMSLLQTASTEKKYGLELSEIAKIWRGGCIIRSALLEEMRRAYAENKDLPNLILDDRFAEMLSANREDWRAINAKFTESRVPSLCLSSALAYFDAFRSERLPANLIQAQRDYFGAHTYQRVDKEGIFHTPDWDK
jgi:6-phosphogluconate dehydrogenase